MSLLEKTLSERAGLAFEQAPGLTPNVLVISEDYADQDYIPGEPVLIISEDLNPTDETNASQATLIQNAGKSSQKDKADKGKNPAGDSPSLMPIISSPETTKQVEAKKRRHPIARVLGALAMAGGLTAVALWGTERPSSAATKNIPAHVHKAHQNVRKLANKLFKDEGCNDLSLNNNRPSDFKSNSFLPPNKADSPKSSYNTIVSWFSQATLGNKGNEASIAEMEAILTDEAGNTSSANNQFNIQTEFTHDFGLIGGQDTNPNQPTAAQLKVAQTDCESTQKLMNETWKYNPSFLVEGTQYVLDVPHIGKNGNIVGVDPEQKTWTKTTPLSAIEFAPPQDATTLGIEGFNAIGVDQKGEVIQIGVLPSSGVSTESPAPAGSGSAPSTAPVLGMGSNPGGSASNPSNNNYPGLGPQPGGSGSVPSEQNTPGQGPTPGGSESQPTPLPIPGPGPTPGGETTPPAPTPTPTPTPPTKPADDGASAENVNANGTDQSSTSDEYNAGGSSDANDLGTGQLAQ